MILTLEGDDVRVLGALFVEAAMFAGTDSSRPILAAVLLERTGEGRLQLVATDNYRLGIVTTNIEVPDFESFMVEAKPLAAVGKLMTKVHAPVMLTVAYGALLVACDEWSQRARVVSGDFPDYPQLLPTGDYTGTDWPALDAAKLGAFCQLRLALPRPTKRLPSPLILKLEPSGALKPLKITASSEHADFVGLLMPVRH